MKSYFFLTGLFALIACSGPKNLSTSGRSSNLVTDGKLWTSFYEQRAAEYKALCLQAYSIARMRLDESLKQSSAKPRAIITDIDETFLDNSPFSVRMGLQNKDYDGDIWSEWTSKGTADTLSGALSFFKYAASNNVEVFYISNRRESEKAGTLQNLQRYQFPFADDRHMLLRKDVSSKESRRQEITAAYDVVLLLGDNLADFSSMFDGYRNVQERSRAVEQLGGQFGTRFIVLPNPNYGGWEDAAYGNRILSVQQKDSAIKSQLKSF